MHIFRNKRQTGFTLIELLVVIAIIGLLASVVLLSLNSAREKSRNAKRLADVRQIASALELYFNDCGSYPVQTSVTLGDGASGGTTYKLVQGNSGCGANDASAIATVGGFYSTATAGTGTSYIGTLPKNPLPLDNTPTCTTANGNYVYTGTANNYTLLFCLGSATGGYAAGARTLSPAGIQ